MIDRRWWRHTVVYRLFSELSKMNLVHCSCCIDVEISGATICNGKTYRDFSTTVYKKTVVKAPSFHDGLQRPSWKSSKTVVEAPDSTTVFEDCRGSYGYSTTVFEDSRGITEIARRFSKTRFRSVF
ncbi:hypothetical protein TIFTF001_026957 [Ficus carica]|uniref:Uncharacterized protein n=1 Tax=Ficus carica TaxID=3494 RepID=A0AA88DM74_FICCA|nr:hypothetical protein TIFTF001_026957 [Ficus carica]